MQRLIVLLCLVGCLHCARSSARVQGHTRIQTLPRASVDRGQYTVHWYSMDTHGNAVLDYVLGPKQVELFGTEAAQGILELLASPTFASSNALAELRTAFLSLSHRVNARADGSALSRLTAVMQTAENMRKRLPDDRHQLFLSGYFGWIIFQAASEGPVAEPDTISGRWIQHLRSTFQQSSGRGPDNSVLDLQAMRVKGASIVIDMWSKLLVQEPEYTGPAPFHSGRLRREIQAARKATTPDS